MRRSNINNNPFINRDAEEFESLNEEDYGLFSDIEELENGEEKFKQMFLESINNRSQELFEAQFFNEKIRVNKQYARQFGPSNNQE